MKSLMVATDGSENADLAVEFAGKLASRLGSDLKIVNIVGEHDRAPKQLTELARQERRSEEAFLIELSDQILKASERKVQSLGVPSVQLESQKGDPAKWIIEIARRDNVDAIIMGKRGLGQLSGLILGSVSQKVVTLAPMTVMVVPTSRELY